MALDAYPSDLSPWVLSMILEARTEAEEAFTASDPNALLRASGMFSVIKRLEDEISLRGREERAAMTRRNQEMISGRSAN